MGFKDMLSGFARPKKQDALRERAKRAFAKGDNAAGVAALIEIGEDAEPDVLFQVGECYETGIGVMPNFVSAAAWYERAAAKGHLEAQVRLGDILLFGRRFRDREDGSSTETGGVVSRLQPKGVSVSSNPEEALRWNNLAAAAGAAAAQARLGYQYATGLGVDADYARAKYWFSAAAEQGALAGQFGLGMLYAGAYMGNAEYGEAAEWFEKAAAQGDINSKFYLAILLKDGLGRDRDESRAVSLLMEAAEADHTEAMFHLGQLNLTGSDVATRTLAETWLRRAASRRHIPALLTLARHLIEDSAMPDYGAAAVLLREAADLGDPFAQFYLGQCYSAGLGVPMDADQAAVWFRKAADAGVVGAIESLGMMHAAGVGLERDYEAAFSLLRKAADAGSASAELGLGGLYSSGFGDLQEAIASYRRSAARGNPEACLRLGVMYATGDGVEQDYEAAAEWYAEADARGNADGKSNLAFLHIRGLGVPQDHDRGVRMLEELADQGSLSAIWSLYHLHTGGLYLPVDAAQARRWLRRAAELGSATAACEFARQIEGAVHDAPPVAQVVGWLSVSAENGEVAAQATLGRWLYEGRFVQRDPAAALRWFSTAAERGNAFAQAWMGDVCNQGLGVMVDRDAARRWYERAAEQRHIGALTLLSNIVLGGAPSDADRERIFCLWLKIAEAGDETAQRQTADFYLEGMGTERSVADAIKWLTAAAGQHSAEAQVQLAGLLLQVEGDNDAPAQAAGLFSQAAAAGNLDGVYNLGVCHRRGIGVTVDRDYARHLYRDAAMKGHRSAQLALGDLLAEIGDETSLREAVRWYEQASAAGIPGALHGLAGLYERGLGVPVNREKAILLNTKAAEAGHRGAEQALSRLREAQSAA